MKSESTEGSAARSCETVAAFGRSGAGASADGALLAGAAGCSVDFAFRFMGSFPGGTLKSVHGWPRTKDGRKTTRPLTRVSRPATTAKRGPIYKLRSSAWYRRRSLSGARL